MMPDALKPLTVELRKRLAECALDKRRRSSTFSRGMPTDWRPQSVVNPETGMGYSDQSAWGLIACLLEGNAEFECIRLETPNGATGYVVKHSLEVGKPLLYIKVQYSGDRIIGRSFHYSER